MAMGVTFSANNCIILPLYKQLKAAGAHIIVVGVGGWTDQMELTQMASFPQKKMNKVDVRRFNDLPSKKKQVVDMICNSKTRFHKRSLCTLKVNRMTGFLSYNHVM